MHVCRKLRGNAQSLERYRRDLCGIMDSFADLDNPARHDRRQGIISIDQAQRPQRKGERLIQTNNIFRLELAVLQQAIDRHYCPQVVPSLVPLLRMPDLWHLPLSSS